jgi:hypothetical protein
MREEDVANCQTCVKPPKVGSGRISCGSHSGAADRRKSCGPRQARSGGRRRR